jgi:hypothetical protein
LVNLKKCSVCKIKKKSSDYLGKSKECYKCVYARKIKETKKQKEIRQCKMCESALTNHRWAYCSEECAAEGKRRNVHWTAQFKSDPKDYKIRFMR